MIASPTTGEVFCEVPGGGYLIEVNGRGFVNYGWPGTTNPGDVWRIRLWPNDGTARSRLRCGTCPDTGSPRTARSPNPQWKAPVESDEPKWITVSGPGGGSRTVTPSELCAESARGSVRAWGGGDPIPELLEYDGGQHLAKYDRALVLALIDMDDTRLREVARWCVTKAYELAGLPDRPWTAPALTALHAGDPLPSPFDDPATASAHFERAPTRSAGRRATRQGVFVIHSIGEFDPFDMGPISRPAFCAPHDLRGRKAGPRQAAFEALYGASVTYQGDARELHGPLRAAFGIAPGQP